MVEGLLESDQQKLSQSFDHNMRQSLIHYRPIVVQNCSSEINDMIMDFSFIKILKLGSNRSSVVTQGIELE